VSSSVRKGEYAPEQYAEYLEKHYRRNLVANVLDVGFFQFSMSVVSVNVVLPAFLKTLGASNLLFSFLIAGYNICWFLPQLFMSFYVEGLYRKKPYVLVLGVFQRVPWLALGVLTLVMLPGSPEPVIIMFFLLFITAFLAGGFNSTAWAEMIAKAIPQRIRGLFMGIINLVGSGLAVAGGFMVKYVMENERFPYPQNYAILFFICFAILVVSFAAFALNREPLVPLARRETSLKAYFKSLPGILRRDRNFTLFVFSRALGYANVMGVAFYMVYAMKRFSLDDSVSGNFVLASTLATVAASAALGRFADKMGHKANLVVSQSFYMAAAAAALLAKEAWMMYFVFVFISIGLSSFMISMNNIIFEFAPESKRPTYLGLSGTISAPFILLFSFLGAKLADMSYKAPIGASIVLIALSTAILVFFVKEPRKVRRDVIS
jgi:MFS family permease